MKISIKLDEGTWMRPISYKEAYAILGYERIGKVFSQLFEDKWNDPKSCTKIDTPCGTLTFRIH